PAVRSQAGRPAFPGRLPASDPRKAPCAARHRRPFQPPQPICSSVAAFHVLLKAGPQFLSQGADMRRTQKTVMVSGRVMPIQAAQCDFLPTGDKLRGTEKAGPPGLEYRDPARVGLRFVIL